MTALELATLLLHLVIPFALIARVALARRRTRSSVGMDVALAGSYLLAIGLAGPWLALPFSVLALHLGLLVLAAAAAVRHVPVSSDRSPTLSSRVSLGVRSLLTLSLFVAAGYALSGRQPFDEPAVDLAFPLAHGTFLVAAGGSNGLVNPHLKTSSGERFAAYRGQSFAVDLVEVGRWGSRVSEISPDLLAGFAIFGSPIHAPCAGVVVAALDGQLDRLPGAPVPDLLPGNHVIVECEGVWIVVAHMKRRSVRVRENDVVRVGDRLGLVGNSGRSDEPHLHIHAQSPGTRAMPLGGRPIPIRFEGRHLVRNDRVHGTSAVDSRSLTSGSVNIEPRIPEGNRQ